MDQHDSQEHAGGAESESERISRLLNHLRDSTPGRSSIANTGSKIAGDMEHIGRYVNLGEIDRGGMGIIFRVQDQDMRRTLAMKVLLGEVLDAEGTPTRDGSQRTSRFLEEAQVTGQLEHPGIIPVHEMGLDASGRLFFTMRLVKGSTLGEVIHHTHKGHEHWTLTRVLGVILKVCEAMAFAHSKRVIHRDLKPANIMVGRFGETYVMDWGLAKVLQDQDSAPKRTARAVDASMLSVLSTARREGSKHGEDSTHSTMEGDILGTPAYMPPEQAQGKLDEMGPASDIYSLGAMLYHLLAGRAPFTKGGASAGEKDGPIQILERVLKGSLEPLEKTAPNVPPELVAICERAMERAPERRYTTMLDVAEDLHAFTEQRVVKAYETGALAEFRKWMARNKGMAIGAAAAIVMAIAGLAAVSYTQAKAGKELARNNAQLERTNLELGQANLALDEATNLARANEKIAREQRGEAISQSYRANVSAAAVLLDLGSAGEARKRLADCDESQRGWEWRFLEKLTNSSLRVLRGHEEFVMSVAFSSDSKFLASSGGGPQGDDRSARIWDTETGKELVRIDGHTSDISSMAFSPGGTELATSSSDDGTILWDVETGEELARTSTLWGAIAYHPDGRRIAIGDKSRPGLTLWDTYEDRTSDLSLAATGGVNCARFSSDGNRLAMGFTDFKVRLIDIASGRTLQTFDVLGGRPQPPPQPELGRGVLAVDLHPRDGRLLSGSSDGSLLIWDVETASVMVSFLGHRGGVHSARFHPDGPWVVSSDIVSSVRFWHSESGEPLEVLLGHDKWTTDIALSPFGDRIASCSLDGTIRLWDGQPGSSIRTFFGEGDRALRHLAFAADSERLAWTSGPRRITIGAVRTGESLLALPAFGASICAFIFDMKDENLLTVDGAGRTCVWNATTGELLDASDAFGPTSAAAFDHDVRRIAMASSEARSEIRLIDTATLQVTQSWRMPAKTLPAPENRVDEVLQLAFSSTGETLAVMAGLEVVSVWEVSSEKLLHSFHPPGGVSGIVFDAENNEIAAIDAYAGTALKFYDYRTGEILREFGGHGILTSLSPFNFDHSRIAVGAADGTVSLWHPQLGEMATLSGGGQTSGLAELRDLVGGVRFSADGSCIASLDWNGTCRIWDMTPILEHEDERRAAARRRYRSREATRLVDKRFEELILVGDVVDSISNDAALDPALRDAAIAMARMRADNPERLAASSIRLAIKRGGRPVEYLRALAAAEKALLVSPNRRQYAIALGAAHYRMGNDRDALSALESTTQLRFAPTDKRAALRHLFLCLVRFSLNDTAGARESLRDAERDVAQLKAAGGSAEDLRTLETLLQEAQALAAGR